MLKKKISKILVPLDGSKNSYRGLETAIVLARHCGAIITGVYSIHAPPHSEFRGVGSVEKSLNIEVKKIMEKAKILAAQNRIVFKEKILRGEIGYNIIKLATWKGEIRYDRARIIWEEFYKRNILWQYIKLCHSYIKNPSSACKIIKKIRVF